MVGTVRPGNPARVPKIEAVQPGKATVNEHIVDDEIDQTVHRDADADAKQPGDLIHAPEHVTTGAWDCKYEEKQVVPLKKAFFFEVRLVVICMPVP